MPEINPSISQSGATERILETQKEQAAESADLVDVVQDSNKERMQDRLQETVHPLQSKAKDKKKDLKDSKTRVKEAKQKLDKKDTEAQTPKEMRNRAAEMEKRNPELKEKMLMVLRDNIKGNDDADDIRNKVKAFFSDVSNQDEALEFLGETTWGELKEQVDKAREDHKAMHERDIQAGRNIGTQAREFAAKGLGSPTALRDLYRDITGNPRSAQQLFKEFSGRFRFGELKKVARFLFHSLGSDMRAQGPSIERAMLQRLMTETRSLQSILGVYRFFHGRMGLIRSQFAKFGMDLPEQMNFEELSKQFMGLASDRYPTGQKVKDRAVRLGIQEWLQAKLIAFAQFRDAVRQLALYQIFETVQHRDEVFAAILEALEEWEEELEELGMYLDEDEEEDEEEEEEEEEEDEDEEEEEDEEDDDEDEAK